MSLNKQLWLIILLTVIMMFATGVVITTASNVTQVNEQLSIKNNDNANLLAQMLTELEKEEVMLELIIAAQFDTGFYEHIILKDVDNRVITEKVFTQPTTTKAPKFFLNLLNINATPGVGLIGDGWSQYGTIEIRSHSGYLIDEMWQATFNFAIWSAIITLIISALGMFIQRIVTKPLDKVIDQAEDLGNKKFTTLPEPYTLEYKKLVKAMNKLTNRIKAVITENNERIKSLRAETEQDKLTGLPNRSLFMHNLDGLLNTTDKSEQHGLIMIRIKNLEKTNKIYGYQAVDSLINEIANNMRQVCSNNLNKSFQDCLPARMNGSDFAILFNQPQDLIEIAELLCKSLETNLEHLEITDKNIILGSSYFSSNDNRGEILMRVDSLISKLETSSKSIAYEHASQNQETPFISTLEWRNALKQAMDQQNFHFEFFPILCLRNNLPLLEEAMIRVRLAGEIRNAGFFMPWAQRLNLIDKIELSAISHFFMQDKNTKKDVAIKLSFDFITNPVNRQTVIDLKANNPAKNIVLEFHENDFINEPARLKTYCNQLHKAGYKIGLNSANKCFDAVENIQEFGIDVIKIHPALIQAAHENDDGKTILKAFCSVANSLGATTIGSGFNKSHSRELLLDCGVQGITGPGV